MWRDTARTATIGPMDARAIFPLLIFLCHWSEFTLLVALVGTAAFGAMSRFGYTPGVAIFALRRFAAGSWRPTPNTGSGWRSIRRTRSL